jgi:hypothetical protein
MISANVCNVFVGKDVPRFTMTIILAEVVAMLEVLKPHVRKE